MGRPLFLSFGFDEFLEWGEVFEGKEILVLDHIDAESQSFPHRLLEKVHRLLFFSEKRCDTGPVISMASEEIGPVQHF